MRLGEEFPAVSPLCRRAGLEALVLVACLKQRPDPRAIFVSGNDDGRLGVARGSRCQPSSEALQSEPSTKGWDLVWWVDGATDCVSRSCRRAGFGAVWLEKRLGRDVNEADDSATGPRG